MYRKKSIKNKEVRKTGWKVKIEKWVQNVRKEKNGESYKEQRKITQRLKK